ncbi:hypothetical protein ONS96_010565 [Cadophora gregata f. sp. sojae]|nr:hypothetical protein ONS96_010565 [Cadophora gregata f. sp. sojae]
MNNPYLVIITTYLTTIPPVAAGADAPALMATRVWSLHSIEAPVRDPVRDLARGLVVRADLDLLLSEEIGYRLSIAAGEAAILSTQAWGLAYISL